MCNVYIGKRRKRELNTEIFEIIMTDNFPQWRKDTKPQIQEAQRTKSKQNIKTATLRLIIFKLQKNQRQINYV